MPRRHPLTVSALTAAADRDGGKLAATTWYGSRFPGVLPDQLHYLGRGRRHEVAYASTRHLQTPSRVGPAQQDVRRSGSGKGASLRAGCLASQMKQPAGNYNGGADPGDAGQYPSEEIVPARHRRPAEEVEWSPADIAVPVEAGECVTSQQNRSRKRSEEELHQERPMGRAAPVFDVQRHDPCFTTEQVVDLLPEEG